MKDKVIFYPERVKIKVHMLYIFLKTFTFWEDKEGFSILVFSLGVKGRDRFLISGGSSRYSAGIEKEIQAIKLRSSISWREKQQWEQIESQRIGCKNKLPDTYC